MKKKPCIKKKKPKKQLSIRIDDETISYFKVMSKNNGFPYQTLMGLYLLDCVHKKRKLNMDWLVKN